MDDNLVNSQTVKKKKEKASRFEKGREWDKKGTSDGRLSHQINSKKKRKKKN